MEWAILKKTLNLPTLSYESITTIVLTMIVFFFQSNSYNLCPSYTSRVCHSTDILSAVNHFTANVVAKNYQQTVIERGCH